MSLNSIGSQFDFSSNRLGNTYDNFRFCFELLGYNQFFVKGNLKTAPFFVSYENIEIFHYGKTRQTTMKRTTKQAK